MVYFIRTASVKRNLGGKKIEIRRATLKFAQFYF